MVRLAVNIGSKLRGPSLGWPFRQVVVLAAIAVLLQVGIAACDRGHELFIVNDTGADILVSFDGSRALRIVARSTHRDTIVAFHPRVKETKKHRLEARDTNGNIVYRVELTEAQLERQKWTITVTKASGP